MEENTSACIFVENLLQFCLEKRGIAWQPAARDNQMEVDDMVFNETIGNAVLITSSSSPETMRTYTRILWDYICNTPDRRFHPLFLEICSVAMKIYDSVKFIENTYVFLAVMVEVSIQCAINGKHKLIQDFVSIIPSVLDSRMHDAHKLLPTGLLHYFDELTMYARKRVINNNLDE